MNRSRIAAWSLAGLLSATTVGGVAYSASADTGTPTPSASSTAAPKPAATKDRQPAWLRRMEHGSFTARVNKTDQTFDVQRGVVTAVSPTSISVRSLDGYAKTYAVDAGTKVRQNGKPATIEAVRSGDHVQVLATGGTALRIQDRQPAAKPPAGG